MNGAWSSVCVVLLCSLTACGGSGGPASTSPIPATPPAAAQAVGYTVQTWGPAPALVSSPTSIPGTADLFTFQFVGQQEGGTAALNSDGSVSITGTELSNGQLASAMGGSTLGTYVGTAFGGGGYFEAVIKFDGWQGQSGNPNSVNGEWPAFWGMSLEHLAQTGQDLVAGQMGSYENFIEMDFMEYDIEYPQQTDYVYSGSIINWYGVYGQTCQPDYCPEQNSYDSKIRSVGSALDFSQYHTYGALWVPATDDADGYIEWFFDDQAIGTTISWSRLADPTAVPPTPPFAVADTQHLVLILTTGPQYPMTIQAISVWQKSTQQNLSN